MDRVETKNWAKEKISGNLLNFWKGMLLVVLLSLAVGFVTGLFNEETVIGGIVVFAGELLLVPAEIGLTAFFINFVKNNEFDKNIIFDYYSQFWKIVGTMLLMGILIMFGVILFIIPGIYLSFSYALVPYLLVERKDLTITETLALSRKMMNGHKLDYFVLGFSFIGWLMLTPFTLGILAIWLIPYITLATTKFLMNVIDNYEE